MSQAQQCYSVAAVGAGLDMDTALVQTLISHSAEGIIATDALGTIRFANAAAERIFGYAENGLIGLDITALMPAGERAAHRQHLRNYRDGGNVMGETGRVLRGQRQDGTEFLLSISVDTCTIDGQRWFTAICHDVTEREKLQRHVIAGERFHRAVLDSLPICVTLVDKEGCIIRINAAGLAMIGATDEQEVVGTPVIDNIRAPHRERFLRAHQRVFAGEPVELQYAVTKTNGGILWLDVKGTPLYDDDDRIIGHLSVSQDVTEQRQLADALAESEARFRQMAAIIDEVLWLWDAQSGALLYVSPAFESVWGRPAQEMQQHPERWFDWIHPDDVGPLGARFAQACESGEEYAVEYRIVLPDGAERWLHDRVFPITDESGAVVRVAGISSNISERRQLEADLAAVNLQKQDISRQAGMGEIATGVLHNVGNVLNSVNVGATLILEKLNKTRLAQLQRLAEMLAANRDQLGVFLAEDERGRHIPDYLQKLTRTLLDDNAFLKDELVALNKHITHIKEIVNMQQSFARQSGTTELVDINELVETAIEMYITVHHGIDIVKDYQATQNINTDRHKVMQVIVNLISNAKQAVKNNPAENRKIEVTTLSLAGNAVEVTVRDNGIGIAAETLKQIFNYGFTTRKDGHGFGLHACANFINELGGRIAAQSDGPGCGAVFTVSLPTAQAQEIC